jgi:hypothetical protein
MVMSSESGSAEGLIAGINWHQYFAWVCMVKKTHQDFN